MISMLIIIIPIYLISPYYTNFSLSKNNSSIELNLTTYNFVVVVSNLLFKYYAEVRL